MREYTERRTPLLPSLLCYPCAPPLPACLVPAVTKPNSIQHICPNVTCSWQHTPAAHTPPHPALPSGDGGDAEGQAAMLAAAQAAGGGEEWWLGVQVT